MKKLLKNINFIFIVSVFLLWFILHFILDIRYIGSNFFSNHWSNVGKALVINSGNNTHDLFMFIVWILGIFFLIATILISIIEKSTKLILPSILLLIGVILLIEFSSNARLSAETVGYSFLLKSNSNSTRLIVLGTVSFATTSVGLSLLYWANSVKEIYSKEK